jgi:molybdopterin synthase catalytic subunit
MGTMIEEWINQMKQGLDPGELGMILVHNGIVRATSKKGEPVQGMRLSYDEEKLERVISEHREKDGIAGIRVWINRGELKVGDDIMVVLVAGRFRTDVLPAFESLVRRIKSEVVAEQERV